jgi:hypothetical protein
MPVVARMTTAARRLRTATSTRAGTADLYWNNRFGTVGWRRAEWRFCRVSRKSHVALIWLGKEATGSHGQGEGPWPAPPTVPDAGGRTSYRVHGAAAVVLLPGAALLFT